MACLHSSTHPTASESHAVDKLPTTRWRCPSLSTWPPSAANHGITWDTKPGKELQGPSERGVPHCSHLCGTSLPDPSVEGGVTRPSPLQLSPSAPHTCLFRITRHRHCLAYLFHSDTSSSSLRKAREPSLRIRRDQSCW